MVDLKSPPSGARTWVLWNKWGEAAVVQSQFWYLAREQSRMLIGDPMKWHCYDKPAVLIDELISRENKYAIFDLLMLDSSLEDV